MSKIIPQLIYDDVFTSDRNYYRATAKNTIGKRLESPHECDVLIVGGGLSGLATALHLIQTTSLKITIIERHHIGWGASGRNGGEILPGLMATLSRMNRKYGYEITKNLYDISMEGIHFITKTIKDLEIDCDLKSGYLSTIEPEGFSQKSIDKKMSLRESIGYPVSYKSQNDVCELLGSNKDYYVGGTFDENAYHFHPLKYLYALKAYLIKRGVSIFEETPCVHFDKDGAHINVVTPKAKIKTNKMVMCGDSYLGTLMPQLRRKYVLIRNAMVATEPLTGSEDIIPSDVCVSEYSGKLLFYRKTIDNRLIIGGGDNIRPNNDLINTEEKIIALCQTSIRDIFPQIAEKPISHVWGGYIGVTSNYLPYVGSQDGKIYYMGGYSGHGVNLTHSLSALIARSIKNDWKKTHTDFDKVRHIPLPGQGNFDVYLGQLGMALESIRERFD